MKEEGRKKNKWEVMCELLWDRGKTKEWTSFNEGNTTSVVKEIMRSPFNLKGRRRGKKERAKYVFNILKYFVFTARKKEKKVHLSIDPTVHVSGVVAKKKVYIYIIKMREKVFLFLSA